MGCGRKASANIRPQPLLPKTFLLSLSGVAFILLDLGQHPIKLARGNLAFAKLADSRGIYLQRRAAIRTIEIDSCGCGLGLAIAYERPVFTPTPQVLIRS